MTLSLEENKIGQTTEIRSTNSTTSDNKVDNSTSQTNSTPGQSQGPCSSGQSTPMQHPAATNPSSSSATNTANEASQVPPSTGPNGRGSQDLSPNCNSGTSGESGSNPAQSMTGNSAVKSQSQRKGQSYQSSQQMTTPASVQNQKQTNQQQLMMTPGGHSQHAPPPPHHHHQQQQQHHQHPPGPGGGHHPHYPPPPYQSPNHYNHPHQNMNYGAPGSAPPNHNHMHQTPGPGMHTPAPHHGPQGHGHMDGNQWRYYNPRDGGVPATPATHYNYGHGPSHPPPSHSHGGHGHYPSYPSHNGYGHGNGPGDYMQQPNMTGGPPTPNTTKQEQMSNNTPGPAPAGPGGRNGSEMNMNDSGSGGGGGNNGVPTPGQGQTPNGNGGPAPHNAPMFGGSGNNNAHLPPPHHRPSPPSYGYNHGYGHPPSHSYHSAPPSHSQYPMQQHQQQPHMGSGGMYGGANHVPGGPNSYNMGMNTPQQPMQGSVPTDTTENASTEKGQGHENTNNGSTTGGNGKRSIDEANGGAGGGTNLTKTPALGAPATVSPGHVAAMGETPKVETDASAKVTPDGSVSVAPTNSGSEIVDSKTISTAATAVMTRNGNVAPSPMKTIGGGEDQPNAKKQRVDVKQEDDTRTAANVNNNMMGSLTPANGKGQNANNVGTPIVNDTGGANSTTPLATTPAASIPLSGGYASTPSHSHMPPPSHPYSYPPHGPPQPHHSSHQMHPGGTPSQYQPNMQQMPSPENYSHDPYYSMNTPAPAGPPGGGYYQQSHQRSHYPTSKQEYPPHHGGPPMWNNHQQQQSGPGPSYYDPHAPPNHGNPYGYGGGGGHQGPGPMDGYHRDSYSHGMYPPPHGHGGHPSYSHGASMHYQQGPPHGYSPHGPHTPFAPHGEKPYVSPEQTSEEQGEYTKMLRSKGPRMTDRKKLQNKAWFDRFEELKKYKEEHGDCLVPQKYPPNPSLGTWVNKQRMEYKLLMDKNKSSMTEERLEALKNIGFTWAKRKGQATWDAKFSQLLDYKRVHGDCLIPTKYSKDLALGRWVSTQREQYRLFKQNDPKSKMTAERARKLEEVGFVWRLQF